MSYICNCVLIFECINYNTDRNTCIYFQAVNVYDCSVVSPYPLLFFGGKISFSVTNVVSQILISFQLIRSGKIVV